MLTIEIAFPAGRYHATPWRNHVNEGIVEWPPSPWRILRALISTWHLKAQDVDGIIMGSLVSKLASTLPSYELPRATFGSTCHYMPLYRTALNGKTSKVYDSFVHVGQGIVKVVWADVNLDSQEKESLQTLLSRMTYLGRAESWVEATIARDGAILNCLPSTGAAEQDVIATLASMSPDRYAAWITEVRVKLGDSNLPGRSEKPRRGRSNTGDKLPGSLFEALQVETADIKANGWSGAPGSEWVPYALPSDAFKTMMRLVPNRSALPTVARYELSGNVLPSFTDTIRLGDLLHRCLVKCSDGAGAFTLCDAQGKPVKEGDTYIFCVSDPEARGGRSGRITDIVVYRKDGFSIAEQAVLMNLSKLRNFELDLRAVFLGMGDATEMFPRGRGPFEASKAWTSYTPFVPTRCPKSTRTGIPKIDQTGLQIGSAEHELRRLLKVNGFPEPTSVEQVPRGHIAGREVSWLNFKRYRPSSDRGPLNDAAFGFRIEFDDMVEGPIALGYGKHFGLGLFVPEGR